MLFPPTIVCARSTLRGHRGHQSLATIPNAEGASMQMSFSRIFFFFKQIKKQGCRERASILFSLNVFGFKQIIIHLTLKSKWVICGIFWQSVILHTPANPFGDRLHAQKTQSSPCSPSTIFNEVLMLSVATDRFAYACQSIIHHNNKLRLADSGHGL